MFTVATLVPMFTIITPGPYTHCKQSNSFHAKSNLKVDCENKMSLITKSDRMSVTDLNHAVRLLCRVVDVCSKLLKDFHDYCLFNMSDQIVVGIVFSCFWLKNYKKLVWRYSMTSKQYFCVEESLKYWKMIWMHSNGVCTSLHAIILQCGTKSVRIPPPNILTDSCTRFLPKTQPYLNSMIRTLKSKLFFITLPKYTLSHYIGG